MNAIIGIALSGLKAADVRLEASARNIANAQSRGAVSGAEGRAAYRPVAVSQVSLASGGVGATLAPSLREALLVYDPSASFADRQGYVDTPDIDLVDETVELATSRNSLGANLLVLRVAMDMDEDALSILP